MTNVSQVATAQFAAATATAPTPGWMARLIGSISAFNKSFRHIAGMSPSDFRRDIRLVTTVPAGAFRN